MTETFDHIDDTDGVEDAATAFDVSDQYVDSSDIAVVGMAGRFPNAETPDEFWNNLRNGHESARTYTDDDLRAAGVPESLLADPHYVKAGTPIDDWTMFDADFFGLGPKDAAIMDPQHRMLLEVAWETLESAGHPPAGFDGDIGVFAGCGMSAYFIYNVLTNPDLVNQVGTFLLRHTGNDKDFLATRISYALDLTGPSVSVQTACSTSLVAIHHAAQSLLQYECDMALAGGVTIEIPHRVGYMYKEGEPLSPDGHCRAFDHRSQGTIFGSGAGMVALRRLGDAVADRDIILGVVKGSGVNNDGSGKVSYLAPSVDGQAAAISEALAVADVDPASIQYVEAHGTGTPMGDPIEVAALNHAFGSGNGPATIALGSVKPNIGHLDTAAGVAGFIKLIQSIRHREIPPSINFDAPNPAVDFAGGPFHVNDRLNPWPDTGDLPARGGISSLGVGGTNAHVIVEEAPELERPSGPSSRRGRLLLLSGRNAGAVEGNTSRLREHLQSSGADLSDVAYSLATTRHGFGMRRTLVATSTSDAVDRLASGDTSLLPTRQIFSDHANLVWLLPGGGSQYPTMGAGLYEHEAVFRTHMDRGLDRLADVHGLDLRPMIFPAVGAEEQAAKLLSPTDRQLPAIFITSYAMARLFESWGHWPRAMAGHSMGQMTAASLAGVMSYEDALDLIHLRGQLVETTEEGGVVSVNLAPEAVEPYLYGRLVVASVNGPDLVVLSGTAKEVADVSATLRSDGVEIREIPMNTAAHSPLFDPILPPFEEKLRSVDLHPPTTPVACNLTGGWLTAENATDPMYWVRHFRNTVRFADNASLLLEDEGTVLVEVGPGRTLSSFVRSSPEARPQQPAIPSMRHPDQEIDDDLFVLDVVGRMWAAGIDLDVHAFYREEQRRRVALPFYAFQHQHYFIEPGDSVVKEGAAGSTLHRGVEIGDWLYEPVWHEEPAPAAADTTEPANWLIFMDRAGVADGLVAHLTARGHQVATVVEGDVFTRIDSRAFALAPEAGRDGYDRLLGALVEDGFMPDRVIHLWSLTTDKRVRAGSSWFHHMQERGFLSLVNLAQAVGDLIPDAHQRWTVVTNGVHAVDGKVDHPEKATMMGPVSVIPHEFQGIEVGLIDVSMPQSGHQTVAARAAEVAERLLARAQGRQAPAESDLADVVARIARDLEGEGPSAHVGHRNGRRYVRSLDRAHLEADPTGGRLRSGGTYLITGGLGGLAMSLADRLARHWKANLILVGRSPVPGRNEWDQWLADHGPGNTISKRIRKLLALEKAGAQVMTGTADVADIAAMERVVADAIGRFGRIDGVLHAAGVVEENLIALKTEHDMDRVLTPKVQGAMVLDRVLGSHQPDFIVYFSSISTALGIPGQVDYAAANAFLDAYARRPRRSGEPERISLAWGPWREVGLAAEAGADNIGDNFEPCDHPLLDFVSVDDTATVGTVELAVDRMWVLDEHRAESGRALLPGTGHMEMLVSTALAAGAGAVEVDNLSFVSPLVVPDGIIRDARVLMQSEDGDLRARIQTAAHGSAADWVTHSEAHVRHIASGRPARVDLDEVRSRCERSVETDDSGIRTRQEDHIIFGDRWRNLRSIHWGEGEALADVALRSQFADDTAAYNVHPAMLDMATGFGLPLVEGYDDLDDVPLYVPMSYGRLCWYAPLEARVFSHMRLRDVSSGANLVRFDITLTNEAGDVLVDIENFAIVKVADGQSFAEPDANTGALGAVGDVSSPEVMFERFLAAGLEPDEGWLAFERILEAGGHPHVFVSPLPLQGQIELIARTLAAGDDGAKFARPDLASEYREPGDEIERGLVQLWEELLGIDPIGVDDDFFELGGHSLIALRLFASIKQRFGVDQPMSVLFDASTVAKLAEFIRAETGTVTAGADDDVRAEGGPTTAGMRHVVQMSSDPGDERAPFFLVAGMFGNILNLRHLAMLLGGDRAVYGIQAKGLRDDEQPHTRFQDMAAAYLAEIKEVQPEGPYFLGGFSGGGITAFEMAQQLRASGQEVAMIAMLDTPLPGLGGELTRIDRILMQLQRMQQMKLDYPGWYIRGKLRQRAERQGIEAPQQAQHEFRTQAIVDAFMEAVGNYTASPYDGDVHLYRPRLNEEFKLTGERFIDRNYNFQVADNGWTGHVRDLYVREVPGDHDSMVLEPNVRVLAAAVVEDIAQVEAERDD